MVCKNILETSNNYIKMVTIFAFYEGFDLNAKGKYFKLAGENESLRSL